MGYTVVDLLEKFISIEKKAHAMYIELATKESTDTKAATVFKVLAKEEEKHIRMYEELKIKAETKEAIDVDFDIYDKASKLFSSFVMNSIVNSKDVKEILRFALNFEKENLALIISIQGLLVRKQEDVNTGTYSILTELMKEEEKHIGNIEAFLKQ